MRTRFLAAAATSAAIGVSLASGGVASAAAPGTTSPDIIGGTTADAAPWGAQIYWDNGGAYGGFECSGTIIAAQWVLTAQHCLADSGTAMHVMVGDLELGKGTEADVDKKVADPKGDMALLHLSQSVDTTYMKLADSMPETGAKNKIYGWGRTQGESPPASQLKVASVKVTGTATDAFGGVAIASEGVTGSSWHGDSGGPQIQDGVQVGVCSTGQNSGSDPHGTQNYAAVAKSRDWIEQTAGV